MPKKNIEIPDSTNKRDIGSELMQSVREMLNN